MKRADVEKNIIRRWDSTVKIKSDFLPEYMKAGADITWDELFGAADSNGYITVTKKRFEEMERSRAIHHDKEVRMFKCVCLNNEAIRLEELGEVDEAAKLYEKNINEIRYPATHAYDRLIVYYRERKDYENEIRVIRLAIEMFPKMEKYQKRLLTATQRKEKQNAP